MNYLNINDRQRKVLTEQLSGFQPAIKECTKGRRKPLSFRATFIDLAQIRTISVRHHKDFTHKTVSHFKTMVEVSDKKGHLKKRKSPKWLKKLNYDDYIEEAHLCFCR